MTDPRKPRTSEQQRLIDAITHRKAPASPAASPRAAAIEPPHRGSIYERHDLQTIGVAARRADASDAARLAARPGRLAGVARMFGAPQDLIDAMNAAGLSVRQAQTLLQDATGNANAIGPAGIARIRLGLAATARNRTTPLIETPPP